MSESSHGQEGGFGAPPGSQESAADSGAGADIAGSGGERLGEAPPGGSFNPQPYGSYPPYAAGPGTAYPGPSGSPAPYPPQQPGYPPVPQYGYQPVPQPGPQYGPPPGYAGYAGYATAAPSFPISTAVLLVVSVLSVVATGLIGIPSAVVAALAWRQNATDPVTARRRTTTGWVVYAVNFAVGILVLVPFYIWAFNDQ